MVEYRGWVLIRVCVCGVCAGPNCVYLRSFSGGLPFDNPYLVILCPVDKVYLVGYGIVSDLTRMPHGGIMEVWSGMVGTRKSYPYGGDQ